jgi:hypothetical protein
LKSTVEHNRMVWDQNKRGHYEVWYCTFNHRASRTGYWIRYTLESPLEKVGPAYCQLWFGFFDANNPRRNFAINKRMPIDQLRSDNAPFAIQMGDARLEHGKLSGALGNEQHNVSWDLEFDPATFTHFHLPDIVYRKNFADTKVLSPNLMVNYRGKIEVDGETYTFEGDPGCQTHLWGRKHAHAWAWGHCNAFREDPTAALEILSVKLKRGPIVTPTMTLFSLYLGSDVYNFRDFYVLPLTRGNWETGLYSFGARGKSVKIEGEFRCRPEDLVRTPYEDPDGEPSFCHNTEVADMTVTVWNRRSALVGFRQHARLTARGTGHFEYASRSPDGRVEAQHQTID